MGYKVITLEGMSLSARQEWVAAYLDTLKHLEPKTIINISRSLITASEGRLILRYYEMHKIHYKLDENNIIVEADVPPLYHSFAILPLVDLWSIIPVHVFHKQYLLNFDYIG